ncbi:MAG: UDP-3-O-3-hydroxymyristoyl glucosamine N-acyltransferase [Elusimicrobia bacterium]|nr:MAG: UDP-3-O-3-hydroxymyristoyl glucosamine N-acyltransferase [Elusimicrobiota bacterium]KAF0157988.1 MAG: UDP-3-O-3-hydroxymyristoyl glucosamine N-acyltransferase [Elusimicrobiota bacterium]
MNFTPEEVAKLTGGRLEGGSPARPVTGANPVELAGAGDLCFIDSADKLGLLESCRAAAVLLPQEAEGRAKPSGDRAYVYVKNPRYAFALVLRELEKEMAAPRRSGRHPSAVVAASASVAPDAWIGPCCVVEDGASVGEGAVLEAGAHVGRGAAVGAGTRLHPRVSLLDRCKVGARCVIHAGTVIGSDGYGYVRAGGRHEKIPQLGTVEIGDEVEIGANCAVDRAALDRTVIGPGTKIDNLVHIAHNVKIGSNCLILGQVGIAGSTEIGDNVIISGQSGLSDHLRIGANSIVMGRTGVIADLKEGSIVLGPLGRPRREFMRIEATLSKLPEMYAEFKRLKKGAAADDKNNP